MSSELVMIVVLSSDSPDHQGCPSAVTIMTEKLNVFNTGFVVRLRQLLPSVKTRSTATQVLFSEPASTQGVVALDCGKIQ
ncbi:hypothetical protein [Streptomyces sp. MBT53]|uniref:hypothetical protein n=1 Tax=Streptomyces sp. MBT53 TaxID=1488384 RepID=UPI001912CBB0|nr:hypothetical protein [Streptomyces sp. MBT53]MBK6014628.1 hypothetical protein [Streptomyces sp. MBT53]